MSDNPEVSVVPTKVTDADRSAAAEHHGFNSWRELKAWGCRESHMMLAEAFARHRLAHQTPPATQPTAAVGEVERLRAAARAAHDALIELNPNNYTHDDVIEANDAAVEAILLLADALGETHGKTPEWWKARRAALATLHTPPPVATATVDAVAAAMVAEARVGSWDKMPENAPRGWGVTASKSYWRKMASAALAATPTPPAGDR